RVFRLPSVSPPLCLEWSLDAVSIPGFGVGLRLLPRGRNLLRPYSLPLFFLGADNPLRRLKPLLQRHEVRLRGRTYPQPHGTVCLIPKRFRTDRATRKGGEESRRRRTWGFGSREFLRR